MTLSSILLVDKRIHDHETIVAAIKADGVQAIVFDVSDIDAQASASFQYMLNKIADLGATSFSNIGIVQHNTGAPFHRFFAESQGEESTVAGVETADPTLQTWAGFAAFITHLKNTYGVQNVDLMACALYSNPDWKYVIDTLAVQTGVTIRASTDDTGAAALGGDWFLESHTGVNLKDVYFTEAIEDFRGVLIYSTKYNTSSLFSTKSMAVGKAVAWGATNYGGGTDVNTITGGVITSGVVALYSTGNAFAALKTNGSVSTWGANGGNQTVGGTSPSVASSLTSGVVEIYTNENALAALKSDGTVITWGFGSWGGSSTSVDLTNVVDIFSGKYAFAALKSNGSLVTWPSSSIYGGNSSTAASGLTSGVVSVNMAIRGEVAAAAALKSDGSVVTWPTTSTTGGNSSTVTSSISSGVVVVYSDNHTFAALKNNGSVINWGNTTYSLDGNPYVAATSVTLSNIVTINNGEGAYAALNINGGVVTWGLNYTGGNSSGKSLSSNVVKVYNSLYAFAALKFDGSVVTWGGYNGDSSWGGNSTSVASDLSSGVVAVYGNNYAFAALKSNGKVITWGHTTYGGTSSSVATDISAGIVAIYATGNAFAALRNDGKLITWGDSSYGGSSSSVSTDLSAGVVSVNNTSLAFAAITSTATTFDLSMSYYRDIDRYNILRNKENRRRVNLTTLNNNVFTLSSARDIQKFNYTIPSGNSFRIIVPDYVSSNYSIISTATLPSPAAANYIIACDEGEPVTISGVTYINYGAFVYRRNVADNTFTKMTSAVIDGVTYKLYGGDGLFSSGIAFQYRFGTFTMPAKAFGDASFNITAPVTDSSGAFTYTSSNTTVATVTTGGTVTIIKIGSTTITATQAANGRFTSDSITASLVVSKADSTLGALTVPAKVISDAPFTLTAPTSSNSSIVSPVYTITSAASMIVPPPDIRDISYGTAWAQMGLDILGTQASENSGYSVSISADGTVIAIGSYTYDKAGGTTDTGTTEGRTRVYKYNGTAWGQLGLDISGTQAQEYSGVSVSLSADGTIVAIGSRYYDITGTNEVGRTRIYKYNGSSWGQLGLDISGTQAQEYSGVSVSLSADGTTVAIGSWNYDTAGGTTNANTNEGRTRIYKYNGSAWGQLGLDISGTQVGENSGYSVSLSADGTTVAIGSHLYTVTYMHAGRTRVYKYNGSSWTLLGSDILGTQVSEYSGWSVSLSADGMTVAIGSYFYDKAGGTTDTSTSEGRTRVYKYNGTAWGQLGLDISGTQAVEYSGISVSLSADGTVIAIGSYTYDKAGGTTNANTNEGRTRIYKYNGSAWGQLGLDISGTQVWEFSGYNVSLSTDGTTVAIGSYGYDKAGGTTNANTDEGRTRIYKIATTNALTYSSNNSSVADVCGNLLLIKGVNGTSTITASQTGNTVTGRLDVSGTTYTLQYNPITFTSGSTSVATVSTYGTVTLAGTVGTSTITATQPETLSYASRSVTGSLVVSLITPTYSSISQITKTYGTDVSFSLTAVMSGVSNSSGAYTFSSTSDAISIVGGVATILAYTPSAITITATQDASGNYNGAGSTTFTLLVNSATPTYSSISQITKTYGTDVSFSLTSIMSGVSNSSGAYTFSTTSAAIDICGGVATILAYTPSAITITATQAASGNYNALGSTTFTLLVNRKVPSYGAFSVPAATYEDAPFSIAAYAPTTESTGVPFTYTSSEPTVATINSDGTVITIIGQGYTTITASQAAGGNYAASSTTTSFLVNRAAPTFLKAFTIPNKTFGDASFSLLPFTEGLDNTDGTYHFTSSNAQLVSISEVDGVTATILAYTPTPITIYVAIDACGNYAASSTSGTLTVARAAPTIGALTAPAKNFGDASFNLTAPTSNSDGAITYTSSAPGVATVTSTGGTVTVIGAGSTTITATQAASGNYTVGSVTASLVVSAIAPTIGALSAPAKNFGDASFNLTAPTSNSGGAFTYTSSAPGVATVTSTGGTVTIVGTGTTTITATQAASADGNYTGGSSVTASFVVSASLSNFTVPTGKVYGDASFNLTDPTTIDNTVDFTFTSSNTAVATISGRTVTIVGAGSSVITASQAATENRAQMDISATLIVARLTPVITLADITKTYGSAQFRLTPTSTNTDDASGAALSFTSSNTDVASIVDTSFVSINGVGDATITIAIAATANFTDGSRNVVVTVNKGTPVLSTFSVSANKTYGSAPFSILTAPTSASAGAITYSSSDTDVATIDNSGVITLIAAGYVNFTATQAATSLYISATKTSNTMTVHRQSIFLTRDSPSLEIVNKTYGDEYFIVSATNAASGGALTYVSDTPSVASVINSNTGVISVVSVGTATITATRAQTAQYTSDPVSWTIQVARATTTLTGLSNLTRNVTVAPFTVTATSASNGAVTYALQDPSSSILTIHPTSGLVRLLSPGSAVIVASQAQGTLYEAPNSITATITVSSAGNALEGLTLTTTTNYSDVNLNDAIINNANISGSNFAGAKLTGAIFTGASIIGATFTNATLVRANLAGISISRTDFTNADLSGAILTGVDASGTIFNNASLANVNLTGANVANVNFTNTSIKGANITDVSFTPLQKLQLLKKSDNRDIAAIAISSVSGPTILAAISQSSPARTIANLDLSNIATTVAVYIPETSTTPDGPITDISLDVVNNTIFYLPINENEYFRINDVIYYSSSNVIRKYATNEIIEVITYNDKPVWLIVGSIIGLVLQTNTMNTSSFIVTTSKLSTDTLPFMPTTLPTSNSDAPIVYSSSSPHLATINATTGQITITGNGNGLVTFTATQVQNATYGPATITSNTLLIDQYLHFSLVGLNQAFNLTTLASLDTLNLIADATDATAVFYVRLSDMTDIFKYQSDSADVNDVSATDLKYYVFHRKWPAELKINPSHAMVNKAESTGMLGSTDIFTPDKALVKHDFVRYIALKLFNTIHGVDLFANETDLQENATYYGESIRHNIHEIMSGISTTSGDESMARDASGNKYLTNSASGNTNLCRELMRQIAAAVASRFYNNGADNTGMKTVPLREEDTITFKVTIQAAATQNVLTGVTEIPSRSYTIKLVLKSSVTSVTNANTVVSDSEMFPNSYPYSSSVTSIAPDSEAAATVYNIYSPPAPIPFSRFGFNGWYYTNSSAWVGVNSGVRNHVKWLVPANRVGSSTVGALQFVRVNLKIHNKTAVPYLMVYTQGGSWRKYIVSGGGGNSLVNGTIYSFYMNFNSYAREPAMIGYTNAALVNSVGSGTFTDNEVITGIAVETDSGAAAGAVEFTLASVIVGEIASGVPSEKEYGFLAEVPSAYP